MNRLSSFVRILLILAAFALCGTLAQCGEGRHMKPPTTNPGGSGNGGGDGKIPGSLDGYPKGLSVVPFTDGSGSEKCTGFYAVVDFAKNPKLSFRPQSAPTKRPTSYFADFNAGTPYIVTNGGFFAGYRGPSLSLVVDDGKIRSFASGIESFEKQDGTIVEYYPVRAALGLMHDGTFDAAWIYCMSGELGAPYAFPSALDNDEKTETFMTSRPTPDTPGARKWEAKYAIGGGPMLVYGGENVAVENYWKEVFDHGGVSGTSRQPRTATGFTADGKLVLLVCDGRGERGSAGFTLSELADKLIALGCTHAINLDGGGSSVFVGKDGELLNMPSDTNGNDPAGEGAIPLQRDVPTAIVIAETE